MDAIYWLRKLTGGATLIAGIALPFAAQAQISADVKACGELKGEPALQACTRVIDSKDAKVKMEHAYFNRGVEWASQSKYDNAIEDYTAVLKINPKSREAYNNRGNAHRRKGNHALAIADYSEAIKLSPTRGMYYRNRGTVLQDRRECAKALADYEEAVKIDAKDASALDSAAWIMSTTPDTKVRNGKRAVEWATKACELTQWKNATYIDTLAAAHAEDGDFAQAVRRQEEALAYPEFDKTDGKNARSRLKLYKSKKAVRLKA